MYSIAHSAINYSSHQIVTQYSRQSLLCEINIYWVVSVYQKLSPVMKTEVQPHFINKLPNAVVKMRHKGERALYEKSQKRHSTSEQ